MGTYIANFDGKKDDIGAQNAYYWDLNYWFPNSYRGPTPTARPTERHQRTTDSGLPADPFYASFYCCSYSL